MIVLLFLMPFAVGAGPSQLGFMMEIAAIAAVSALTQGLALVLAPPMESGTVPLDALDIDGAVIIEPTSRDTAIEDMKKRGLAVVSIGKQPQTSDPVPYADIRSAETARLLLEHLRAQGARRIALLIDSKRRNSHIETEEVFRAFAAQSRHLDRVAQDAVRLLLDPLRGDKIRQVVEGPHPELIVRASSARR